MHSQSGPQRELGVTVPANRIPRWAALINNAGMRVTVSRPRPYYQSIAGSDLLGAGGRETRQRSRSNRVRSARFVHPTPQTLSERDRATPA